IDRARERKEGLVISPVAGKGVAARSPCFPQTGLELQGAVARSERFVETLELHQGIRPIEMAAGIVGSQRDGFVATDERLRVSVQPVQRKGAVGVNRRDPVV